MNKNYFSIDEDFNKIINTVLSDKNIVSINPISTGWTNIVFEVATNEGNFFFRFPRDDFWIRTIVKDYEFSKYIYGKTDFNTVKLELFYDNGRPFSMHKKIEGTVLADKMNELTPDEIRLVAQDISKFMYQLHHISFDSNKIFDVKNIGVNLVDFIDELLDVHVAKPNKVFWKYEDFSSKPHNCLVHGDLNSSNVLLDSNNRVTAFIDFGFGGFGNEYFDIARIIGRCPESFKSDIIKSYESLANESLDKNLLDSEIKIWTDIDNAYINYMKGVGIF